MRILAVDPGSKRFGIAISDETGTIANPLKVVLHVSRLIDAATVVDLAVANRAGLILVGQSLDENGLPTYEGRRAQRFAEALKLQTSIPVLLWDEAFTTQAARSARLDLRAARRKRAGHLDDLAATALLQDYLDTRHPTG
jgi:putative Holliday junction resolvase